MTSGTQGAYVIAAGGTGGHIFPGIAVAREIQSRRKGAAVIFFGTRRGLERKLVPAAGFPLEFVPASGFAGKGWASKLLAVAQLPRGFFQARRLLRWHDARVVAGVGGYVTVPVITAARSLNIPTVIHESNAFPGVANRFLNRFATRTAVGFQEANHHFRRPGVVTGIPVRAEFFSIPPLEVSETRRRLLVFGGSQGSRVLNSAMLEASPLLREFGLEVIHQTGEKEFGQTRERYGTLPKGWKLEPFLPRLQEEMAWADLVLSRAGSQTLAELAASGRPSLLVPFSCATHAHQLENARAFSTAGASAVIEEERFSGRELASSLRALFSDRKRLVSMGEKARSLARREASRLLADLLFEAEEAR